MIGTVGSDEKAKLAQGARLRSRDQLHAREFRRARQGAHRRQGRAGRLRRRRQGHLQAVARLPAPARPDGELRQRLGRRAPFNLGILAAKGSLYVTRPTLDTYVGEARRPARAHPRPVRCREVGQGEDRGEPRSTRSPTRRRRIATWRRARRPAPSSSSRERPARRMTALFPAIEPYAQRHAAARRAARHVLGAVRQSARRAGRVPARRARRRRAPPCTGSSSIRRSIASSSTTSAAPGARRRSASCATTPRRIWSKTSSACAQHLGIERWLVFGGSWGIDARARLRRGASRALPRRSCCAASSSAARARSTGSSTACATIFPGGLARVRRTSAGRRTRRPAAGLPPAPHRSRPGGAHARGARVERLRGLVLDAAAQARPGRRISPSDRVALGPRAHRGALLRERHLPAAELPARQRAAPAQHSRR